jgi:hypothetical protein
MCSQYGVVPHHYTSPLYVKMHWDYHNKFKILRIWQFIIKTRTLKQGDTSCLECKSNCKHSGYIFVNKMFPFMWKENQWLGEFVKVIVPQTITWWISIVKFTKNISYPIPRLR